MASSKPYELVIGQADLDVALDFRAYGVIIQNFTAEYVYVADVGFIPPNTSGGMPLAGTNKGQARFLAPPGVVQPIGAAGQTCFLTYTDYPLPPTAGPTQGNALAAVAVVERFARALLPAPGNLGRLVEVTDSVGGLFLDMGTRWVSLNEERMNAHEQGAIGDGVTNDQPALQAAANKLGVLYLPGGPQGAYRIAADLVIPSGCFLICAPDAKIVCANASVRFGANASITFITGAILNVEGSSPAGSALVEITNVLGDHRSSARQFVVTLTASTASTFVHLHSVNGIGLADVKAVISTSNFQSSVGIHFINGTDAAGGVASIAGDFINGNEFEGTLSCTDDCVRYQGTGPVGGSVLAPIARPTFFRVDMNSFGAPAGAGVALRAVDGGVTEDVYHECTFETGGGGAVNDIDFTLATGDHYFLKTTSRAFAAQLWAGGGARVTWLWNENNDANRWGIFEHVARYFRESNTQIIGPGFGAAGANNAPFVSTGRGTAGRLYIQGVAEIEFDVELSETVAGATYQVALYRSTIGVPANGAAIGGGDVQVWASQVITSTGAGTWGLTMHKSLRETGLPTATTIFYYLAYGVVAGGGFAQVGPNPDLVVRGGS